MKIQFAPRVGETDVLVFPVEKDGLGRVQFGTLADGDQKTLLGAAEASRFDGESGAIVELFVATNATARRVILLGLGAGSEADYERAGGSLVARLLTSGVATVALDFSALPGAPDAKSVARFAASAAQRAWRFDVYRTRLAEKLKPTLATLTIAGAPAAAAQAWVDFDAVTKGMALTRELVTEPANIIYPQTFVERVERSIEGLGLEVTALGEAEMRALGMGALLGVSQGSRREARLLALKWSGAGAGDPEVAFVGKGVTFDTGGISIKPAAGMEDMKWDMGGAAAVVGAMKVLALRKARANVIGVCGLVENMPDGNAQRPGDVVTSMSGQTIEVINTDAEGRLVLCDALCWVQKTHRPRTIIDLATLTGAIIVALGHDHAGLFSNDDALATQLSAAGVASGDKLWRMPVNPSYDKLLDSPIADMKNVGPRAAGSITAAQFLQRFIEKDVRWAHLDIAGMAWADKPGPNYDKGATGFGVRILDRFIRDNVEK